MNTAAISNRIIERIDDDPAAPGSVTPGAAGEVPPEILAGINEGQELACLLTLCLETAGDFVWRAHTAYRGMLGVFVDYLVPLRLMVGGRRIRPATIEELVGQNEHWAATPGTTIARYMALGCNLLAATPQPDFDLSCNMTYARLPAPLIAGVDVPELPEGYHHSLIDYGIYYVRLKEGAQGLSRGISYLNRFLDDMTKLGDYVRTRSMVARYDVLPFELQLFDRSRLAEAVTAKSTGKKKPAA